MLLFSKRNNRPVVHDSQCEHEWVPFLRRHNEIFATNQDAKEVRRYIARKMSQISDKMVDSEH